jgi:alkyl hydroperoxide reductase subunit AhpC
VFDEEPWCARTGTFIIDRGGAVSWSVITPIRQARDVEEYVQVVRQLR